MDLKRKLELARSSVESISRHDDLDAQVRHAALDKLVEIIEAERAAIEARIADSVKVELG